VRRLFEHKSELIIESQYFGSINYINTLFQFSNIYIEQYEAYQKMSFRNRCVVAGSNGLVHLSVPLEKGRNQRQLMKDTRISYSGRWQAEHLRTIESCYSRSPYFEFYRQDVWKLVQKTEAFLLDKNLAILEWLQKVVKLSGAVSLTAAYHKEYPPEVADHRNQILPKNFQDQPRPLRYTQVFEERIGFQPNLCILDLLFCNGPDIKNALKDNELTF
jgi:hypothetical protein